MLDTTNIPGIIGVYKTCNCTTTNCPTKTMKVSMEPAWLALLVAKFELAIPIFVEIRYGISSDTYLVQEWRLET